MDVLQTIEVNSRKLHLHLNDLRPFWFYFIDSFIEFECDSILLIGRITF